MGKRGIILFGMGAGLIWALAVVGVAHVAKLPFLPAPVALPAAFILPGLALLAMIARLAQRRFFDDDTIDGQDFAPGSGGWVDQRVLTNTVEQLVLALLIWPFVAQSLGGAVVIVMGMAFALARVVFWVGYHVSPPLRGFGFAASFYPTIVAAVWSVLVWAL